jgi:flagellar biosynthesis protein FliQ
MVEYNDILSLGREAMILALLSALPILGAALLSSLLTAVIQSIARISETALSIVPRILAVGAALIFTGPWIGHRVALFATKVWSLLQGVGI